MPESLRKTLDFLRDLRHNNDREWFNQNKKRYETARAAYEDFIGEIISRFDGIEDLSGISPAQTLYRINRDVRFSPDKSPYKTYMGAFLSKSGRKSNGRGYYLQLDPYDGCFIAGGVYMASSELLSAIREFIVEDPKPLQKILDNAAFKRYFGTMFGDQLKTAPKGYSKDHPLIALLRYKQFLAVHTLTEDDVLAEDFADHMITVCKALTPFHDYFFDRIDPALLEKMKDSR